MGSTKFVASVVKNDGTTTANSEALAEIRCVETCATNIVAVPITNFFHAPGDERR